MHLDMPLHELEKYQGKNPKPDDFDLYWEQALQQLDQQSLSYELEDAAITCSFARCHHLYFRGVGENRIHAKLIVPNKEIATGQGMAIFHGYSVDSGDWLDKLAYAAEGVTVIAMDCRGQGGRSEDLLVTKGPTLKGHVIRGLDDPSPEHLYYRQVFLDTVQTVRILKTIDGVDSERIGVYGQSQGGALATACAALEPTVKHLFAVYPFLSDYERAWEMDMQHSAYEEIAYFFRCFDPTHHRHQEIFSRLGYIDIQHLADRIKASVQWITAMRDPICPPSTQFAAYNKIRSKKDMMLYHEYGHEHLPNHADEAFQQFIKIL
ncbi:acetylxylan esterase [Gracilibacillus salinarum]|uniref:Acetylxylan esterase n=1 Tax=Gracilibacillus salinarum TaxID=2932255 RepID=A0ABY4GL00_9BACI|nr:alpha/beta fold hydrolase [Gracilibacillus salinarum]UOQ85045.1 acetylxylan esterase [Gracilibacillus salinarum]